MWISDEFGTLLRINQACRDILKLKDEEVIGKYNILKDNIVEEQGLMQQVKDVFEKGTIARFIISYDTGNIKGLSVEQSKNLILDVSISPIINSDNKVTNAVIQHIDISKIKQAELIIQLQNKKLMDANASKDKFFSIIAHDLKGPFVGFLGLTDMMQNPNINLEEMRDFGAMMNKSAGNLFKLLENLLTWARMQQGVIEFNPQSYNLFMIVSHNVDVLSEFAKKKNIELSNQIPKNTEVVADLEMIETVLRNLISNAIKFTKRGGKIVISAEGKNAEVLISVQDSGIGISEKMLSGIFRVDVKTSRPGTEKETSTGLGLLLCKEFIEKHNGKIWAESEIDKGSTFYFTLSRVS